MRRIFVVLTIGLMGAALVGCGSSKTTTTTGAVPSGSSSNPNAVGKVTIDNFAFSTNPSAEKSKTVSVTNNDSTTHTFTFDDGSGSTGNISPGQTKTVTAPSTTGFAKFHCEIHSSMKGELKVF